MTEKPHLRASADAERERLMASLAACTAEYFGTPPSEGSLAQWDLTDIERAIMNAALRGGRA